MAEVIKILLGGVDITKGKIGIPLNHVLGRHIQEAEIKSINATLLNLRII